jgi:hypothetical protein
MGKVSQRKRHRQSSRVHHPCIARPATMPMAAFAPLLTMARLILLDSRPHGLIVRAPSNQQVVR